MPSTKSEVALAEMLAGPFPPEGAVAEAVREGWMDAPHVVAEGTPPRKPVASWDELRRELDADRADR